MLSSKVLLAQLGARKHYQEPLLLHNWSILESFYTDFYASDNQLISLSRHSSIYKALPRSIKKILDRYEPGLKNAKIVQFPLFSYQYSQFLKKAAPDRASQIFLWAGQEFCQRILQKGLGDANTIYGFNSACLELFEYAKKQGLICILDQTLADYSLVHQLLLEEERRWPKWSIVPFTVNDADLELMEREHYEQDLADRIICGSSFVKDSLIARGVRADKITVVPLGRLKEDDCPANDRSVTPSPVERGDGLKILFVGSVNLRKGIPYLLEALRKMKGEIPFTCKVIGTLEIQPKFIAQYSDVCNFMGRIPRSQIKDFYNWADVFVLPSICEGSAMVTYEALSLGVPIITTYHSGSIVRDGIDGYIVPIQDSNAIAEKLLKIYLEYDRHRLNTNTKTYLKSIVEHSEAKLLKAVSMS